MYAWLVMYQGGKRLLRVMVERLVEFASSWRRNKKPIYEGRIHRAVTTLMMLVIATKGHDIPKRTRGELVHWLDTWATYGSWSPESMTFDNNLPMACRCLSSLFKPKHNAALASVIKQRRRALKCVEVCALPACVIETELKVCARWAFFPLPLHSRYQVNDRRCKTVAYVSLCLTLADVFALMAWRSAPRSIKASTGNTNTRSAALKLSIDWLIG
jgi:hypothetical protein